MNDPVGTVRVSPDGVVALRSDGEGYREPEARWLASTSENRRLLGGAATSWWRSDRDVADWKVVYTPPKPLGTIMRRDVKNGWEVAILNNDGWLWVSQNGILFEAGQCEPKDDEDGSWEVLR